MLDRQLTQGLASLSADVHAPLTIAYEPVWAIGKPGHGATPQQAQEAHAFIRRRFGQMFGEKPARRFPSSTAAASSRTTRPRLLSRPDVDGALIGGASLKADQFLGHRIRAGISVPQTEGKAAGRQSHDPGAKKVRKS